MPSVNLQGDKIGNAILLTTVSMLYIISRLVYFMARSLYIMIHFTHFTRHTNLSPDLATSILLPESVTMVWLCFQFICLLLRFHVEVNHLVFGFLSLIYFTKHNTLKVQPCCCKYFILIYGYCIYISHLLCSLVHQWTQVVSIPWPCE